MSSEGGDSESPDATLAVSVVDVESAPRSTKTLYPVLSLRGQETLLRTGGRSRTRDSGCGTSPRTFTGAQEKNECRRPPTYTGHTHRTWTLSLLDLCL